MFKLVQNPYADVDFSSGYIGQFHVHTSSHGSFNPATTIDKYKAFGTDVLAITDHDTENQYGATGDPNTTYPWSDYGRNPATLNMVAVEGNELSHSHHTLSLYNNYFGNNETQEDEQIYEIGQRNGLAILAHPGAHRRGLDMRWYSTLYERFPHLIGQEVVTEKYKYSYPIALYKWDWILTALSHKRPVWGFCNDDLHSSQDDFFNVSYNVLFPAELTSSAVRSCIEEGRFYSVHRKTEQRDLLPELTGVSVSDGVINVTANHYDEIQWMSRGKIIHKGNSLNYGAFSRFEQMGTYARIQIESGLGTLYSNPFRFRWETWVNPLSWVEPVLN